jgi:glutamate 5-kinase
MAGDAGSELSRGGMKTKIEAGQDRHRCRHGHDHCLGPDRPPAVAPSHRGDSTWFDARQTPLAARKAWIGGTLEPWGRSYPG